MGARGPRKTLPIIDRLNGSPGKRRRPVLAEAEVAAAGSVVVFDHLHVDAQRCVSTVVASMPPATYGAADSFDLAAFATAWALHSRFAHEVSAPGFQDTLTNAAGTVYVNPLIGMLNKQALLIASLGDRLGLDPKARAALRLPKDEPASKFDGLLGGRNGKTIQ